MKHDDTGASWISHAAELRSLAERGALATGGRGHVAGAPLYVTRCRLQRLDTARRVADGWEASQRDLPGPEAVETHPQPWDGGPMLMGLVVTGLCRRFLGWNAC